MDQPQPPAAKDSNHGPATGRTADSPSEIPAKGWKQVASRTWKQSTEDNIGLVAAGVAFYGFLALVPLLGATVLTYGLVAAPATVLKNVNSLTGVMPADAAKLVGDQLMSVVKTSDGKKGFGLLLAIAIALFGARNAAGSVITALNIAYEEKETRGLIKVNLLALAITAAAVVLAIVATVAIAGLGHLQKLFPHLPDIVVTIGKIASFALLLAGAAGAAATLYRYGPNRQLAKWTWITPGSIFAALGSLLLTLGFGFYASKFGNYGKTYGSLATVVVLLTWMYLSAYVLLFGAELNSELEHQTTEDTTSGAPRPLGQRGAWSADHVASSDEPEKPEAGEAAAEGGGAAKNTPDQSPAKAVEPAEPSEHPYLVSRVAARAAPIAGGAKIGMLGSALATIGSRNSAARAGQGLAPRSSPPPPGLAFLRRKDD